jgi:hypothetical protein
VFRTSFLLDYLKMYEFIIISIILSVGNVGGIIPIGINMDGLVDWSLSLSYVDLVRQASQWGNPTAPWIANATFDPRTGWPTSDFGMILVSNAYDLGGRYLLSAKGNADVKLSIRFEGHIENKTYDPITNTLSAIVFILQNTGFRNFANKIFANMTFANGESPL